MNAHRLWRIVISYRAFLSSVSILSVGVGRSMWEYDQRKRNAHIHTSNAVFTLCWSFIHSCFFLFIRDSIRLVHVQKENAKKVKEAKKRKKKKNNDADGNEIKNVEFNREKKKNYHYSLVDGTSCISVSILITETTLIVQSSFDVELVCWKLSNFWMLKFNFEC